MSTVDDDDLDYGAFYRLLAASSIRLVHPVPPSALPHSQPPSLSFHANPSHAPPEYQPPPYQPPAYQQPPPPLYTPRDQSQ